MASKRPRPLSQYPRPWFYRPEFYFAFIIFPPVWSVLTLRSPWHKGEGFLGIMVGGVAWFFIIFIVVMSFSWVSRGNWQNLFVMPIPGLLLTLLTQVQWAAHCAQHGPPPVDDDDAGDADSPVVANRKAPSSPAPRRRRRRRRRG